MTIQPELFPSNPADADAVALLDLIAGDPVHEADRLAVVEAICAVAAEQDGRVDPNAVRERIPAWVYPRVTGSVYSALARQGLLTVDGWTLNDDVKSRNRGKPTRTYQWNGNDA